MAPSCHSSRGYNSLSPKRPPSHAVLSGIMVVCMQPRRWLHYSFYSRYIHLLPQPPDNKRNNLALEYRRLNTLGPHYPQQLLPPICPLQHQNLDSIPRLGREDSVYVSRARKPVESKSDLQYMPNAARYRTQTSACISVPDGKSESKSTVQVYP